MPRVLRIVRENRLLDCDRPVRGRGPEIHDHTITSMTFDRSRAGDAAGRLAAKINATGFVIVDHCSGECLSARAALR